MTKGPYSQFITTRHYQLAIRQLFVKPKAVLPQLFNHLALAADINTLKWYSDTILYTKPDETIIAPDIFNYQSLLATVKSGCFAKFKWIFETYQFISLIYSKQPETTIFTSPEILEYFIGNVIRVAGTVNTGFSAQCKCNAGTDGFQKILYWLLFSQNTSDDINLQECTGSTGLLLVGQPGANTFSLNLRPPGVGLELSVDGSVNLRFYNTREKMDYKSVYLSAVTMENWDLAQQILVKLISPRYIQTGKDILQPSLKAGIIAGNRQYIDYILSVAPANGEWLAQGRTNNFSELENIIRCWHFEGTISTGLLLVPSTLTAIGDELQAKRVELLTWYLQTYFHKYGRPDITNEELGLYIDFTNDTVGYLTPELWQVINQYFNYVRHAVVNSTKKFNMYAKKRFLTAIGASNLQMAELLLEEYLGILEQTDCKDWVIHIPSDTLIRLCGNKHPGANLAMLKWLWNQTDNFITDWAVIYSSARTWILKYYNFDNQMLVTTLIRWIWDNICMPRNATLDFAINILSENTSYVLRQPEIINLIITCHPILVPKIWEMAIKWYNRDIIAFLLNAYPNEIQGLAFPYENYFRGLFTHLDFSCLMIETFPNIATRINADMVFELITKQYGVYKSEPNYLPQLLALFPIDGNVSQHSNYIFHYANRNYESVPGWRSVLYKICLLEPDKYSVILDPEQPNNLALAQFHITTQYNSRDVNIIDICPICKFTVSSMVTSCGHQFCEPCITKWLQHQPNQAQKNCPYCRTNNPGLYKIKFAASTLNYKPT